MISVGENLSFWKLLKNIWNKCSVYCVLYKLIVAVVFALFTN